MNFKKIISTSYLRKSEEKKLNCPSPTGKEIKLRDKSALLTPNHNCLRECMHTWSNS